MIRLIGIIWRFHNESEDETRAKQWNSLFSSKLYQNWVHLAHFWGGYKLQRLGTEANPSSTRQSSVSDSVSSLEYSIKLYAVAECNLDIPRCIWTYLDVSGHIWMYLDISGVRWLSQA